MIHKLISASTASFPTGLPLQEKIGRIASGPFAGRLLVLFARTPSVLAWSWSDPPYTSWWPPVDFVTDADDRPFASVMDVAANVYVAYTQKTTGALICTKLIFANGTWAVRTPVTVYQSATSVNSVPSVLRDLYDRIWVSWARDDSGTVTLRVKKSVDDALSFGTGSSDSGTDLSSAVTSVNGRLIARATDLHCLFTADTTMMRNRRINLDAALWDPAETLYTGTGLGADFTTAVSPDGVLGVCFAADASLMLKEYDGAVWGALQVVDSQAGRSPSLSYTGTVPSVLFLRTIGSNQSRLFESHRDSSGFTAPSGVLSQLAPFGTVFCLDADAGTPYADLTAAAATSAGADVVHPTSGALLAQAADAVFCGADDRFSLIRAVLSTAGVGGNVVWSYWNGTTWTPFVPDSGTYHFDSSNAAVRLFPDADSSPDDWQKLVLNGVSRYWVRAVVETDFTTPPVGSQLTAVADIANLIPLRE